jgi:hypothetical protein
MRRRSPGSEARATSTTPIAGTNSNGHRRQDGYAAPTADDRAEAAAVAAVQAFGYSIAVRCLDCGHWLANPASVSAHRGPTCAARKAGAR